uniref:aminotransferase class IV n=1 Tax=Ornithobacterium rhinotracheale TaxID=28251 RepID=UPI0039A48223
MINFNGNIIQSAEAQLDLSNDFFQNGLIITEKLLVASHKILFAEQHYFNLMAAMRMSRIEIPLSFTPEFFENQINQLLEEFVQENLGVRFDILYHKNKINFVVRVQEISQLYRFEDYAMDLYRESFVSNTFFDRINFLSPVDHILGIYCQENDFSDLLLQNDKKELARSLKGSIFVIKGTTISTPSIEDGAKSSVLRNKILDTAKKLPEFDEVQEGGVFPFAVTKADEAFVAIDGQGIVSLKGFKKTKFSNEYTQSIVNQLFGI